MKGTKTNFLLISCILFLGISCSRVDEPEKEINATEVIKSNLNGLWVEIEPCDSCNTYQFSEDSIIQFNTSSKERLFAYFEVVMPSLIKITRDWEIEESKRITENKIFFLTTDTLEIKRFLPVDHGLTEFENIKIYKTR